MTTPPASDPLTQARRRFFGALILFGVTVVVLPFVMDAEPPAPLKEPSIEVRDDRQQVILSRRPVEALPSPQPPVADVADDRPPQPSATPQTSSASQPPDGSQPSAVVQPSVAHPLSGSTPPASHVAKPAPPAAGVSHSATSAEPPKERAPTVPPAEPSKPAAPPAASAQHGEPLRTKPSANAPVWSAIAVNERARAEAALRGLTGPGRPLEQFWYLQAGAFKEREAAEGLVVRLRSAGLPAFLVPPSGASDGGWYRVRVAPYVSEGDAKVAAAQVARVAGNPPSLAVARISR